MSTVDIDSWNIVPSIANGMHLDLKKKAYSSGGLIFPLERNVFNALKLTSFNDVKVCIIGADPYINYYTVEGVMEPEAHGLCFSVQDHIHKIPPSLRNILKEIADDVYNMSPHDNLSKRSNLERLANQGVLLLNSILTVIAKKTNSHRHIGWEILTDDIIKTISTLKTNVVFLLWGAYAQKKESLIDTNSHLVLKTSHPSPLSSYRGFFGSKHFSKTNHYLESKGLSTIVW